MIHVSDLKIRLFTWLGLKSPVEDKGWIHAAEYNCSIYDDLEL